MNERLVSGFVRDCDAIRARGPLIHCITNYVAMNFNANALLAVGASPLMSFRLEEMRDVAALCDALYVNIGCPDRDLVSAAEIAVRAVGELDKPWVLDPVGAGATQLRTDIARALIRDGHPSIIRGNASEIMALAGRPDCGTKGVDSSATSEAALESARELASGAGCVVVVSGATDFITDGRQVLTVGNGSSLMCRVSGTGCTVSALCAAFAAVDRDCLTAAWNAMAMMAVAGERAASRYRGTGSLQTDILDELSLCDARAFAAEIRGGLKESLRLYLVTDRGLAGGRDIVDIVREAVAGGVTMVQLREKDCSTQEFVALGRELKTLLSSYDVPLIINDRVDVALACNADGVHIGQSDMPYETARRLLGPDKIIGLSVENMDEVIEANRLDVDYIGVSPVFATPTKTDTAIPFGLDGLREAVRLSRHPVVGIGGMNASTAADVMSCGADGIAVVSAIVAADSPGDAARELLDAVNGHCLKKTETE